MLNQYFIIGTDTDCGKTYVTTALIHYFKQDHHNIRALKPIASGCNEAHGLLINSDVMALQKANGESFPAINGWSMPLPLSPHLAAKAHNVAFSANDIWRFCQVYPQHDLDYLLIEGAGGLMVPLNETETWVDFLKLSQLPVLMVVGMRLGCLNHALLTALALQVNGIACAGWVANFLDPNMLAPEENLQTLVEKLPYSLWGRVAFNGVFTRI